MPLFKEPDEASLKIANKDTQNKVATTGQFIRSVSGYNEGKIGKRVRIGSLIIIVKLIQQIRYREDSLRKKTRIHLQFIKWIIAA